jgi:stage III sporulation protein AD
MDIFKICGVAILCAVLGAVLGRAVGGVSVAVRLAGLCLILGAAVSFAGELRAGIDELGVIGGAHTYIELMMKALGVAVLCRICSDVCRDCGETGIAAAVESAGKLSVVLLALPVLGDLVEYAKMLAEKV